jgi:hypothetical protein
MFSRPAYSRHILNTVRVIFLTEQSFNIIRTVLEYIPQAKCSLRDSFTRFFTLFFSSNISPYFKLLHERPLEV